MSTAFKKFFIGEPFPSSQEIHERLDNVRALAVFASDPISSNAYATEAIMSVLLVLGSGALSITLPLGIAVALLVLMVIFSYIQTILHYPSGGGAYIVAKDNLGRAYSLYAGAALLTDYVLTVSVSSAAGVRAVTSAFPELTPYRVWIALAAILFITWMNMRGMRESGSIFALPTYAFVIGVLTVIAIGIARSNGWFGLETLPVHTEKVAATASASGFAYIWLLLRAFAGGCTALTGIEAISDGVKAFRPPESKNAAKTMVAMGVIAMSLFIGITYLATHMHLVPEHHGESILSQLSREVVGNGFLYYWVQIFTALILFLAANTGYQDFPRLSYFLAQDGFLPRWMGNRGDRLVYSAGIVVLALTSALVVIIFQANEIAMLPLYALGVMLGFTLSQSGMANLMKKIGKLEPGETAFTGVTHIHYESGWRWKRAVNIAGAIVTGLVFLILVATKFLDGAWIIAVAIPALVLMFNRIKDHYVTVSKNLSTRTMKESDLMNVADVVLVPIADVHRGTLRALQYARRLGTDVRAVCISTSAEMRERVERRWARFPNLTAGLKLHIIDYDFRDIVTPLAEYIEEVNHAEFPDELVTVVVPEFLSKSAVENFLHNRTAQNLHNVLRATDDIILIAVPYQITPLETDPAPLPAPVQIEEAPSEAAG